jgi:carboxypeptidase C (cathepsin A)
LGAGPITVAEGGAVVANPSSLTQIANLVYLEPRRAGFSRDVTARLTWR